LLSRAPTLYVFELTWTLLKADIAKLEAFQMTNQRHILGICWYEVITNVEFATLSQLLSINEGRHSSATSCVWIRLLLPTKPYISQSRHDRAQGRFWRRQPGHSRKCWVEQVTTTERAAAAAVMELLSKRPSQ